MAVVPGYGRQIQAPGPVPWNDNVGPLYNAGLAALAEITGDMAGAIKQRDNELVNAYNATEIVKRSAQYSLDVTNAAQRAAELRVSEPGIGPANADGTQPMVSRLASPDEQEEFFKAEVAKLEQQYGQWEKGIYGRTVDVEARARLKNAMVSETARQMGNLRQAQRVRMMQEIEDRFAFNLQTAIQTNNPALLHESLAEVSPFLSEAKREQILAGFDTDVQTYSIRKQLTNLGSANIPLAAKVEQAQLLSEQASELLKQDMPEQQRNALLHVQNVADSYASQQKVLAAEALKQNDLTMMSRTLATVRGVLTGENAVTFDELEAAMAAGQISREVGTMAWDRLARKADASNEMMTPAEKEAASQQRLRSYALLTRQMNRYKQGKISYTQWSSIFNAHQHEVSEEDAEKFIDQAAAKQMTEGDHAMVEAEKLAENTITPLFVAPNKEYDEPGLDEAMGYIMQRITNWKDETFTADKPFDEAAFRKKANSIIDETYREWSKQIPAKKRGQMRPTYPKENADYKVDDLVTGADGRKYKVVGFDQSGEPLVELAQ